MTGLDQSAFITSFALYGIVHSSWKLIYYIATKITRGVITERDKIIHAHILEKHKPNFKKCYLRDCTKL